MDGVNRRNVQGTHLCKRFSDKYLNIVQIKLLNSYKKRSRKTYCQIRSENFLTKIERFRDSHLSKLSGTSYQNKLILNSLANQQITKITKTDENCTKKRYNVKSKCENRSEIDILMKYYSLLCSRSYKWNSTQLRLLLSGDVETNPGPPENPLLVEIGIITYNARGLKDKLKLKRVLNTCYKILQKNRNYFIMLQETHLEIGDEDRLKLLWRHGFVTSPGQGRQRGTMILFDKSWEVVHTDKDSIGRFCLLSAKKFNQQLCLGNIYAPNEHDITFFTTVYDKLLEYKNSNPEAKLILGGDFNLVLGSMDSLNRGSNAMEIASREMILQRNVLLNLTDVYRHQHNSGGFTWARGNCMSRLDMIFITKELINLGIESKIDWGFDSSDHAMVEVSFKIKNVIRKGKGLYRVNTCALDNPECLREVKNEVRAQISTIPVSWNPHKKLDFLKVVIRSVLGQISGREGKKNLTEHDAISKQLNLLKATRERILSEPNTNTSNRSSVDDINRDIIELELELKRYLDARAKFLMLRSGAKWYEEGEKSNAYFLNLINSRSEQTFIGRLDTGVEVLESQKDIMNYVTSFYQSLYEEKDTDDNYDDLFSDLPELNDEDRKDLDRPITMEEIEKTLQGCQDTAPGPDGIPYKVYKSLWPEVGQLLLDAWNQSVATGMLPDDQRASCITLLPKSGKNIEKIENWRPITLTNCDLKVFTKLISDRVSKKLDKLIIQTQTAYIPGRVVHDNLRIFDFYSNYCQKNNVDALLISLDAKKAFDSVSHKYLHEVLKKYGFSDNFISTVKMLYNDIKANILVNGYKSVIIKIARSVKQGDALSCALFILCIDPLLRKIENNGAIKAIPIPRSRYSNIEIKVKTGGFADDVGMAVKNETETINAIFNDYYLFSRLSGIELNVNKTEIMKLNLNTSNSVFVPEQIRAYGREFATSESVKICGVVFSNNKNLAYKSNIKDKILKLEKQIVRWLPRGLSMEGKLLIVKTFGLSQLIYSLQMCKITDEDLKLIEGIIFKFLWNRKWVGNQAPDRIKRDYLKLPFSGGGLNAPDMKDLNSALKTKQFIRANASNHPIRFLQLYLMEKIGYYEYFKLEYAKLSQDDDIISNFQSTTNRLVDKIRVLNIVDEHSDKQIVQNRANVIASTDILEYLHRKKMPIVIYRFTMLANLGIETFSELLNEYNFPRSDNIKECARDVLQFFPTRWQEIVLNVSNIDSQITFREAYLSNKWKIKAHKFITVKGIRRILLECKSSLPNPYDNLAKFEIPQHITSGKNPFQLARKALYASRDKFFKYRILHGDIFCNSRMHRFKMVNSPNCSRCPNTIETVKHLLWECPRSRNVWDYLNLRLKDDIGYDYVNYETIILGGDRPIYIVEILIVWLLRVIMSIERDEIITNSIVDQQIKTLFNYEKISFGENTNKFKLRWESLESIVGDMNERLVNHI